MLQENRVIPFESRHNKSTCLVSSCFVFVPPDDTFGDIT